MCTLEDAVVSDVGEEGGGVVVRLPCHTFYWSHANVPRIPRALGVQNTTSG